MLSKSITHVYYAALYESIKAKIYLRYYIFPTPRGRKSAIFDKIFYLIRSIGDVLYGM